MGKAGVRLLLAAMAIAVAGCSHTRGVESVRLATLSFERGMTAADVEDILGPRRSLHLEPEQPYVRSYILALHPQLLAQLPP